MKNNMVDIIEVKNGNSRRLVICYTIAQTSEVIKTAMAAGFEQKILCGLVVSAKDFIFKEKCKKTQKFQVGPPVNGQKRIPIDITGTHGACQQFPGGNLNTHLL